MFSAHSSRAASTSYSVNAKLPLQDILKAGGWTNARVFAQNYNKPISENLGQTLLTHFDTGAQGMSLEYLPVIFVITYYWLEIYHSGPFLIVFIKVSFSIILMDVLVCSQNVVTYLAHVWYVTSAMLEFTSFEISWYSVVT